jgi:hypothetical protein
MKILRLIVVSSLLYGCASCGPASWAEETEARFQCGMSVEDVRKIAGRDVEQRDVPRSGWKAAVHSGLVGPKDDEDGDVLAHRSLWQGARA